MNTATLSGTTATPTNANGRLSDAGGDAASHNPDSSAAPHQHGSPMAEFNKPNVASPAIANKPADANKPPEARKPDEPAKSAQDNQSPDANKAAAGQGSNGQKSAGSQPGDAARPGQMVAAASNEMSNLRADLDNLIGRIPHLAEAELTAAKETLLEKYGQGKKTLTDATTVVRETVTHGVAVAGDYVKERPLKTVAVTAGIGILLGMLISRSR